MIRLNELIFMAFLSVCLFSAVQSSAVNYTAIPDRRSDSAEETKKQSKRDAQRVCTEVDRRNMKRYEKEMENFFEESSVSLKNLKQIQAGAGNRKAFIKVYSELTEYAASDEFEKSAQSYEICGVELPELSEPPFWMQ